MEASYHDSGGQQQQQWYSDEAVTTLLLERRARARARRGSVAFGARLDPKKSQQRSPNFSGQGHSPTAIAGDNRTLPGFPQQSPRLTMDGFHSQPWTAGVAWLSTLSHPVMPVLATFQPLVT
ncbi:hypothetical protein MRB53_023546 [Persea americana]|uniref:Uncharacterized protein n=1 Tax=Persea americana TaxID=3435 RepID=A0ACC2LAY2_PERAE|nr:hypothetical protein MRB53_023546 [Persea americana]